MIRRASGSAIAAAVLLLGAAAIDSAAAGPAGGTESFRRTCSNVHYSQVNGRTVLHAECDDGRTTDTFAGFTALPNDLVIPAAGCADIANVGGILRCIGAAHPGGSWSQSCVEGRYIRGRVFQAICAPYGSTTPSVYTSVDMNSCRNFRLKNTNGRLQCD